MKGRLALAAMLAGSLTFLVSLYFPWLKATVCFTRSLCVSSHDPSLSTFAWGGFGQIAALLALALAAGAIAAAVDRERATRLPLGRVAVALGIFAVLSVAELWTSAVTAFSAFTPKVGLAPSAYIGLAGVGVACAGAAAARWGEITRPRRATAVAGTLITLALIASFVLPALNASAHSAYEFILPFQDGLATFVCVFACLGLLAWHGRRPGPRLATAAAIGVLVAAQLLPLRHESASWPYELWLLVACTTGLLALSVAGSWGLRIRRPAVSELVIVAASVLLLVSLFLPWQSICQAGRCSSQDGWSTDDLAGVFALGLLLGLVWAGRFVRELAIGAAVFALAAGLATATTHDFGSPGFGSPGHGAPPRLSLDVGALLGFAGAALLVVFALSHFRPTLDRRFLSRLAPVLAAMGILAFAVAPNVLTLGDILSNTNLFAIQSPFLTLGLMGATAVLLTLRLVDLWFDTPGDHAELVFLPLALLALTALAVIHDAIVTTNTSFGPIYGKGVSWEGWVAVFLCVLLVACGWVVRKGAYPWARTDGSASTTSLATSP